MIKPKRIVNKDLVAYIKTLPCLCCTAQPSDCHHVKTVGSGGGDTFDNMMPLCREHHTMWHKEGPKNMVEKFPAVKHWLIAAKRDDVLIRTRRKND